MQELHINRMVVTKVISGKWCQCEIVPSANLGGRQM